MLLRTFRQLAAAICKELGTRYVREMRSQPGQIFFPKRIHELGSLEPDAPDGLSLEYLRLAVAKNAAVWKAEPVDTPVTILAAQISHEICCAALLERHIARRID